MRRVENGAEGERANPPLPPKPLWLIHVSIAVTVGVAVSVATAAGITWLNGDLADGLYYLAFQNAAREFDTRVLPAVGVALVSVLGLHITLRHREAPPLSVSRRIARAAHSRRWRAAGGGALAVALLLSLAGRYRAYMSGDGAPNVVLIVIDTLRADHVGSYGYPEPTTPQLDALSAKSIRFRTAYSSAAWTRPAIASILTATSPFEHGITADTPQQVLSSSFLTLQEYLRNRHYWTAAFISNPHYRFGIDQNFDETHYCNNCPADRVYDQARAFLDQQRGPFFLLIHNNDPHDSYDFHVGFSTTPADSPYRRLEGILPSRVDGTTLNADSAANHRGTVVLEPAALRELKANYDGEIAFLDYHLGRFLDELRNQGLLERTIVVVTADHGEEFLDHGSYWHGATLFEELIRVPLLLSAPGLGNAVIDTPVGTIDIFPTVIDLLGAPALPGSTGQSLLPLLRGDPQPVRTLVAATALRSTLKYAVMRGTDKLITFANGDPIGLFDLHDDPSEQHDRCASDAARCAGLASTLLAFAGGGLSATAPPQAAMVVDESVRQRLRALGYGGK